MIADQAQALRSLVAEDARDRARFVAITSGKGGVGKTNIAVNLAVRLASMGRRVVLLDADLGLANADVLCGLTPRATLAHVIAGRSTLEHAMIAGPGGFQLIPGASGLAQVAALNEFARNRLVQQTRQLEEEADLVLVDTGAGISPNVMSFLVAADQVLVVTTPEPTSVTDAYAVIKTLVRQRPNDDGEINLLVNMAAGAPEGQEVFDRVDAVCQRFLDTHLRFAGHVKQDARVAMAVRRRRPFVLDSPGAEASAGVSRLAHRLDRHAAEPRGEGLFRRMTAWLSR